MILGWENEVTGAVHPLKKHEPPGIRISAAFSHQKRELIIVAGLALVREILQADATWSRHPETPYHYSCVHAGGHCAGA